MGKRFPIFSALVFFAVLATAQTLSMPDGFRRMFLDESGKTWRETGELPLAPDDALAAVKEALVAQGYHVRHDIGRKNWVGVRLLLFAKGESDDEIIVSLWKKAENLTGCSWGVSAKNPPQSHTKGKVETGNENNKK